MTGRVMTCKGVPSTITSDRPGERCHIQRRYRRYIRVSEAFLSRVTVCPSSSPGKSRKGEAFVFFLFLSFSSHRPSLFINNTPSAQSCHPHHSQPCARVQLCRKTHPDESRRTTLSRAFTRRARPTGTLKTNRHKGKKHLKRSRRTTGTSTGTRQAAAGH